jgi:tetratricopeptide (TPR) repeat protein
MKTTLLILLLAGVASCTAQQSAQTALGVDDIRDAILAANAHNIQEAIRLFTDAIQLRTERVKDPALSATEKSNLYYFRAVAHQDRGRVYGYLYNQAGGTPADSDRANQDGDDAIADYGAAIGADPTNAEAYRARGTKEWDDDKKAIADFTAALQLNVFNAKQTAETYYARADHYSFRQPTDAIADYTSALRLDPRYAAAYYQRARLYDAHGHSDLAIADYSSALSSLANAPTDSFGAGDAYYRRGEDEDQAGRHDLAIADYTAAIAVPSSAWLDPNNQVSFAYEGRAKDEERKGQYDLAVADCTMVLEINGVGPDETGDIYKERGDDYAHIGQDKKAAADHAESGEIQHDLLCNQEGFEACSMSDQ